MLDYPSMPMTVLQRFRCIGTMRIAHEKQKKHPNLAPEKCDEIEFELNKGNCVLFFKRCSEKLTRFRIDHSVSTIPYRPFTRFNIDQLLSAKLLGYVYEATDPFEKALERYRLENVITMSA